MGSDIRSILALISRIGNAIPCNSGSKIEAVEADPAIQQSIYALIELSKFRIPQVLHSLASLLETVSKSPTNVLDDYVSFDVLQSQLVILKIMSRSVTVYWKFSLDYPDVTIDSIVDKDGSDQVFGRLRAITSWDDPPPLDDTLAKYLLSVMQRYLIQANAQDEDPLSHSDALAANNGNHSASSNGLSHSAHAARLLIAEQYHEAGRIIFFLSSANWPVVFGRLKNRFNYLSSTNDEWPETGEIRLLECSHLNQRRLSMVIQELNVTFLHLKKYAQQFVAISLRKAIWSWIAIHPEEFATLYRSERRLDGGPEILFDIANSLTDNKRRICFWPLQTMLLVLCPDILLSAALSEGRLATMSKKALYLEQLRKQISQNKIADVAAICYVDFCKASTYVYGIETSPLKLLTPAIEGDLKAKLFDPSKPWSFASDNISEAKLMTDCLVALYRLNPSDTLRTIIPSCLSDSSPASWSSVLVKACYDLILSEHTLPWQPSVTDIYPVVAAPFRKLFHTTLAAVRAAQSAAASRRANPDKKLRKQVEDHADRSELLYDMLRLYRLDPILAIFDSADGTDDQRHIIYAITTCLNESNASIRVEAMETLKQLHSPTYIDKWGLPDAILPTFWRVSSQVLLAVSRQILDFKEREDGNMKHMLKFLQELLIRRNLFLSTSHEPILGVNIPDRLPASVALEICFLVMLCSYETEIVNSALKCIGHLCTEAQLSENIEDPQQSLLTIVENMSVYMELSSTSFVPNGKIAQQKRIRKILRMMRRPTPGNLAAWEEVYKRWKVLTKLIARPQEDKVVEIVDPKRRHPFNAANHAPVNPNAVQQVEIFDKDDPLFAEWSNYAGFLCSLGGCCATTCPDSPVRSVPDFSPRYSTLSNEPAQMVERFVQDMLQLVISDVVGIREAIKDILGNDLNPHLYIYLFRGLEAFVKEVFNANGSINCQDRYTIFIEQTISMLKLILDRMQEISDNIFTVDFGAIVLTYTKYLHHLGNGHVALRIKIKLCQLCEVLMAKREYITFRQEIKLRNQLLEILINWTTDSTGRNDGGSVQQDENAGIIDKLHRDLDLACLKTIVIVLSHLPLQPSDLENDLSEQKAALFYKYFTFFIKLLNRCRVLEALENGTLSTRGNTHELDKIFSKSKDIVKDLGPLKDQTILALSNLLSANVDAGLKYSLSMGYHEDNKTRTAFMQVLTNILNQGTEFEGLAENAIYDRYEKLVELVLAPNMSIALQLCDVCPVSDIDDVAVILLNVFLTQGRELDLLRAVIEREVASTDNEAELFRRNSMATRMLVAYGKKYGNDFLRSTLHPVLLELVKRSSDTAFELDPTRTAAEETTEKNLENVKVMTQTLIDVITNSVSDMPSRLRAICAHLSNSVGERFPDAKFTAVGGFIFLRFFCPAIVAPESEIGLKVNVNKMARRGLVLFAKIIQNLANNVLFGNKEPYMRALNEFLSSNIYKVTTFLRDISIEVTIDESEEISRVITDYDRKMLHKYLFDNLERIGKGLSIRNQSRFITQGEALKGISMDNKRAYDKLSNLLAQLGPPPELKDEIRKVPEPAPTSHHFFKEFMRRNAGRSTESIASKNIFYEGGINKKNCPVFYFIARKVITDSIDFDLLMYYMLKTIEPALDKPYDIVIDSTMFPVVNETPTQWLQQLRQIFPMDSLNQLDTIYIYNPNSLYRKYIKSLVPRSNGITNWSWKLVFATTLAELQEYITLSEIRLPKQTMQLETENNVAFHPVIRITNYRTRIPVILRISKETLQITTSRKQDIVGGYSSILNDVFHVSQIEIPPVQPYRSDENEFSIKFERGRSAITLTSPRKELILQTLRKNKARLQQSQPSGVTERVIRPSDVPGTLLNMALLNLGSDDHGLRLAAYNLLCSLSMTFNFEVASSLVGGRGLHIPSNDAVFVSKLSEKLAGKSPSLTLEFLSEFFVGFKKCTLIQKQHCLQYLAPWLLNLAQFCRTIEVHDQSLIKTQEIIRSLIQLTYDEFDLSAAVQLHVWTPLVKVDELLSLIIDEFIAYGVEHGLGSSQSEVAASTMVTLSSTNLRGKIISRLRKIIAKTGLKPSRTLTETSAWPEIATMIRYALMLSFETEHQIEYVPELFHCVSMLVATGPSIIRASIHGIVINLIQNLCTTLPCPDEGNLKKLSAMLSDLSEPKHRLLFGLSRNAANAFVISKETLSGVEEGMPLSSLESIVHFLLDVINIGAASVDQSNSWRARWMSLITSTAFLFNPAIQPRAFVTLGCLAKEEVDDDLLYQILVALRGALAMFSENDSNLIISIVMCLTNIVESLAADSRYLQQMFWLSMSLVEIGHIPLFPSAINLVQVILNTMDQNCFFSNQDMTQVLLAAREPIADICTQIDSATGLAFETHFSFAVAGTLIKGLRHPATKTGTTSLLMSFLKIASRSVNAGTSGRTEIVDASILGYLAALLPISAKNGSMRELLWHAGIDDVEVDNTELQTTYYKIFDNLDIPDNTTALLLVSLMVTMLEHAENEPETLLLYGFLAEAGVAIPEVFALVYETLLPKMNQIISSSSNISILEGVQSIMYTIVSEPLFVNAAKGNRSQLAYLEELNFAGLMDCGTFQNMTKSQMIRNAGLASQLVDKMVL